MPAAPTVTYAEQPAIVALHDDQRLIEAAIVIDPAPRTYFLAFKIKGLRGPLYLCTRREPQAPRRFYQLDVALRWLQEHVPGARIELIPPKQPVASARRRAR
jgi:hypothetical protein